MAEEGTVWARRLNGTGVGSPGHCEWWKCEEELVWSCCEGEVCLWT